MDKVLKEVLGEDSQPIYVEKFFPVAKGFLRVMEAQNIPFELGCQILGGRFWENGVFKEWDRKNCEYIARCTLLSFLAVKEDTPEDTPFYKAMRNEIKRGLKEDIPGGSILFI